MKKTNNNKLIVAMVIYVGSVFLMSSMRDEYAGHLWYWGLTILPMVPMAYAVIISFQSVINMDEMMRRIHMEAIVFSTFFTGFTTFSWSLMSNAGLPDLNAIWVFPMLILSYVFGLIWRKRVYS